VWSVQEELPAFSPIVYDDGKAAGSSNDEFLALLVSVTSTLCARRHVIQIICASNGEGNVATSLDKREIPSVVCDLGKINDLCLPQRHFWALLWP
jgi:hypothetical protein